MAPPADKSVCWTKYLTKLPKFSILYITNYLQTCGKEKAENWGYEFYYSSITASDFSVRLFVSKNIKVIFIKMFTAYFGIFCATRIIFKCC